MIHDDLKRALKQFDAMRETMERISSSVYLPAEQLQRYAEQIQAPLKEVNRNFEGFVIDAGSSRLQKLMAEIAPEQAARLTGAIPSAQIAKLTGEIEQMRGQFGRALEPASETWLKALATHLDIIQSMRQHYGWIEAFTRDSDERLAEVDLEARALAVRRGWIGLDSLMTIGELEAFCEAARREGEEAADDYICALFNADDHEAVREIVRSWLGLSYFAARQPLIEAALDAHKRGQWALGIPLLLTFADGLSWLLFKHEATFEEDREKQRKRKGFRTIHVPAVVAKFYGADGHNEWALACATVVDSILYKHYDFETEPAPFPLNRHGVLHGHVPDFGTEANSLRVILLVHAIARAADEWTRAGGEDGGAGSPHE